MARRDVDLVIRAKDEAEKVLRQITAALEEFSNASRGVDGGAEKAESSLGQLGAAISTLEKKLGGLEIADKLGTELDLASKNLARIEKRFEETQTEARQLERRLAETGVQADRFASKLKGATAALAQQKSAIQRAKTDQRELAAAYASAEKSQERLSARQAKLPALIERQSAALQKAEARYRDLADQIERTDDPSRTLVANFEASGRAVDQNTAKLNKLTTEYSEIGGRIRAAGSAMVIFGSQAERAAANVEKQQRALTKIGDNLRDLKTASDGANTAQGRLQTNLTRTASNLDKQEVAVARAEGAYVELALAAQQADAQLAELSQRSLGRLDEQLVEQGIAANRARQEFNELDAEARQLRASIGAVGVPTREMANALSFAEQKADEAQLKFLLQQETLERMGRAYREVSGDLKSTSAVSQQFEQEQRQLAQAMQQVSNEGLQQRNVLRGLNAAYTRAASTSNRLEGAARRTAAANERAAQATGRLAAAYRQFYGDTRRSLSLLQRIRGEVLSLIAAYGGLYGVIEVLRGTVDAYQTLEAAQARLTVAVGGDQAAAAQELDFLRRTADRLGITFGTLATEYSKFSIATRNTNLEGEATRKIFVAVAEAARVNRSSTREMAGVFTALTQIVSKGAVQMEELRQQLGDRLPGAIKIMADGLGVGTDELIKMMENGEVTADALVPFAEELQRKFGAGLPAALESTSTSIGRLANEAFEALLRFGQAGFLEAFTDLADTITATLQSADFRAFSDTASAALARLVNFIGFAIENFRVLAAVLTAFIGLKLTPVVLAIGASLRDMGRDALTASAGIRATGTAAATTTGRLGAAAAAVGRLRGALLALLSSTGIGLLVAAIGAGVALWATEADNATEAMVEHEKIVDDVKNAYDRAGGSVEGFGKEVAQSIRVTDARRNLRELQAALADSVAAFNTLEDQQGGTFATRFFGKNLGRGASKALVNEIDAVIQAANRGEIEFVDLADAIDEIAERYSDGDAATRRYAEGLVQAAADIKEKAEAARRMELVIISLTGTEEEAEGALRELNGTVKESAALQETAAEKAEKFQTALRSIQETVPRVKAELDLLEKSEALEKMVVAGLRAAQSWSDVVELMRAAGQAQSELDNEFISGGGSLVDRIIGVESGGNPNAKNPRSTATGLGQFIESTWLRMFKQYFPERASALTDAAILELRKDADVSRKMVTLYVRENAKHLRQAGVAINDASLYLAHFLGPGGATALLRSAPGTVANDVLGQGQIDANRSILDGKTREQVIAWAQRKVGISATELDIIEDQNRALEKQAEERQREAERAAKEQERQRQSTADRLSDGEFAITQQERINAGKEREAAIEEAIRQARADDPNITAEEIAKIKEQTGALFDLEQAKRNSRTESEAAQEAEREVNNLLAQRTALQEQLNIARQNGDQDAAENLRLKMTEVNAELSAAIDNAIRMWEAVGGTGADAAIAKLQTAKLETQNFGNEASRAYLQWDRVGDLFVTGLASAFDTFAQKVAEGKSVGEAARESFLAFAADFLRQIAQMILQQAIFNALRSAFGGTGFGSLIGVGHTGGLVGQSRVGSGNSTRRVSPAMFAGAMRYHSGGLIGLKPGEVPIIAKQGEEMLTRDDPRHMLNGGGKQTGGGGGQRPMTIINTFDAEEAFERAVATPRGQELLVNAVRSKRTEIKAALG